MDLPLRCILSNVGAMVSSVDISAVPMRYLLSDIAAWNIEVQCAVRCPISFVSFTAYS